MLAVRQATARAVGGAGDSASGRAVRAMPLKAQACTMRRTRSTGWPLAISLRACRRGQSGQGGWG